MVDTLQGVADCLGLVYPAVGEKQVHKPEVAAPVIRVLGHKALIPVDTRIVGAGIPVLSGPAAPKGVKELAVGILTLGLPAEGFFGVVGGQYPVLVGQVVLHVGQQFVGPAILRLPAGLF